MRVEDGIEGLVHISELAQRHVEVPEQVAKVGDEVFVKVIDIDLERRRISLSLKQANEGVDPTSEDFDPSLYGMAAEYDEQGNYKYPEGFDPETNEWLEGYDAQREAWEAEYAAAHAAGRLTRPRSPRLWRRSRSPVPRRPPRAAPPTPRLRRRPPALWPPMRPWPLCARSSLVTEHPHFSLIRTDL